MRRKSPPIHGILAPPSFIYIARHVSFQVLGRRPSRPTLEDTSIVRALKDPCRRSPPSSSNVDDQSTALRPQRVEQLSRGKLSQFARIDAPGSGRTATAIARQRAK
jgi:hypothetical protein